MNATERTAITQGASLYDDLFAAIDDRTLEIVDRRRRTATIRRRGWLIRRMLLLADVVGLAAAFAVAHLVLAGIQRPIDHVSPSTELLVFLATLPGWVVMAKLYGLYAHDEERTDHSTVDDFVGVFHLITVGAWLFFAGVWLTDIAAPNFERLLVFWGLAVLFVTSGRAAARAFSRRRIAYLQNTLIVGAGDVGQLVAKKFLQHPEYGINLVGFVDAQPRQLRPGLEHVAILGAPERLPGLIRFLDVERVVIAFSTDSHEELLSIIRQVKDLEVQVDIVPRLFEVFGSNVGIHTVEGLPLVGLPSLKLSPSSRLLKRVMDTAIAVTALVVLAPVLVAAAVAIKLDSPGSIFFRQVRMGGRGRTFRILKFRTMTADADQRRAEVRHLSLHALSSGDDRMLKVKDDPRITRVGRFLRRTSIDEIPQLLNVIAGDMSLVGPRPLPLDEDEHVLDWGRQRLDLKPGVTGLWQVLGRSDIPFDEMLQLDYVYVTNWSLWNDLKLIFRTVPVLFRARGAY
jgi:exopolysaccharide biosynthesis polyprenyl glycosylphosphotransferase